MAVENQKAHEEILSLVNSDVCVSYRFLANVLDLPFDSAKDLLGQFKDTYIATLCTDCNIESVVCLGLDDCSNIKYVLVPGYQLSDYKTSLGNSVKIVSEFVYSVFRISSSSSTIVKEKVNIVYEQMKQTDFTQARELLLVQGPVTPTSFLLNSEKKGGIINPTVSCKPVGQKQLIAKVVSNNLKDSVVESAEEHIARMFAGRTKTAHTDKKKIVSAASFFGSSSNSQAKPKEEKKPTLTKSKAAGLSVNDEEEWDDGDGYKVSKDNLKKRKTAEEELAEQRLPKIDAGNGAAGGDDDEPVDACEDQATPSKKKARSTAGKKATFVHGAMDDYFEDVAIENHINTASSLTDGNTVKKKKKKLIEKTVVDAEGYLVTTYVEEEVTDDESSPVKKSVAPKAVPAAKAIAKPAAATSGAKPKGMMSFFSAAKK